MTKKGKSGGENIRVVIRCRDLLPYEAERGDKATTKLDLATNQVIVNHAIGDPDVFAFDGVYNNTFTQRDIFLQEVQPLADAVIQGYNATVFAYGQSGSGKTHTMTGKLSSKEMYGMMPQVVDYLFSEIKKIGSKTKVFKIKVSYVELYNGKSRDLLSKKQVNLEIKQNMAKNFYVKGAEMPEVTCFEEAIKYFNAGTDRRQTASTDLNDTSSRSHSLFTVQIEQLDFELDPSAPVVMTSKINVVDLAGSEKLSKTNATGDTAVEGCNINLSLSALATVIDTIVKGGKHIPYRGSPLTMLLKDSLGGNAKTVMFANVGPSDKNTSETISTLRFALRAKQIENKPLKNIDPKDQRIQNLLDQIEELTARLGNVDLNVEDGLKQRIEELEIENNNLQGGADAGNNAELEEQCRKLQSDLEEKEKELQDRQKELTKETERCQASETNHAFDIRRLDDLRAVATEFIQRIYSDDDMTKAKKRIPKDNSFNMEPQKWDVKEIGFFLNSFIDLYECWRKEAYTQEDLKKYGERATEEVREQVQRQLDDANHQRDELIRQRDAEETKRAADNEALSQLKVTLTSLKEENTKLREKVERDQEKIKSKLNKGKEEQKALNDQIEGLKNNVDEKDRDIERLKRMIEDSGASMMNRSVTSQALFINNPDEHTAALVRQLEEERNEKQKLESRIRETNVSLRRFGVCITDASSVRTGNGETTSEDVVGTTDAFILAAADEAAIDGDIFAQLQQQIRIKQRLTELEHQHHMRLQDMVQRYELLKTGKITDMTPGAADGSARIADEAAAQQVVELLQAKENEIEELRKDKEITCDKLVKKLNKSSRRIQEVEGQIEEERAQAAEEKTELMKENTELHAYNQQLAVELETLRGQLNASYEKLEVLREAKEGEVEYLKDQIEKLNTRIDDMRGATAEFEELRKSYARLQLQIQRSEQALSEKSVSLESNRQMVKWSNALLEQEKKKTEELERRLQVSEAAMHRKDEVFKEELSEHVNKQVAANNRRLEAQAEQFQSQISEEQAKHKLLQKKIKSAKAAAAKAAQRYDEMILENEAVRIKLEEVKVTSMKMFLEKQEAQRDLDTFRPTVRSRGL